MKKIFELTKREQRVIIFIVVVLVAIAFAKHWWQTKPGPPIERSTSMPTPSPTNHANEEQPDSDGSR
jgi:hypothetical protein